MANNAYPQLYIVAHKQPLNQSSYRSLLLLLVAEVTIRTSLVTRSLEMDHPKLLLENAKNLLKLSPETNNGRVALANRAAQLAQELRETIASGGLEEKQVKKLQKKQLLLDSKSIELFDQCSKIEMLSQPRKLKTPQFDGTNPSRWFDFKASFETFVRDMDNEIQAEQKQKCTS